MSLTDKYARLNDAMTKQAFNPSLMVYTSDMAGTYIVGYTLRNVYKFNSEGIKQYTEDLSHHVHRAAMHLPKDAKVKYGAPTCWARKWGHLTVAMRVDVKNATNVAFIYALEEYGVTERVEWGELEYAYQVR